MDNWIFYATYASSQTTVRTLPTNFSELFIKASSHVNYQNGENMLIPRICIPDVSSVNQALGLVQMGGLPGNFSVCKIWANNVIYYTIKDGSSTSNSYDIYYR